MNIQCDSMAKDWLIYCSRGSKGNGVIFPHEKISCFVKGNNIVNNLGKHIKDDLSRIAMRKKLSDSGKLSTQGFDLVDWVAQEKMMSQRSQQYRLWLTKHVSGF